MARIKSTNVLSFFKEQITLLESSNKLGTARNYRRTLSSFSLFLEGRDIPFRLLDEPLVIRYESWLRSRGVLRNSSSFYMRVLRSVYNKAVTKRLVKQTFPFQNVYTGVDKTRKRAIDEQHILDLCKLSLPALSPLALARDLFLFSYCTRGMAFVDMAFLCKKNIHNGYICYTRKKTGQQLVIRVEPLIQKIISRYAGQTKRSQYLLPIISSEDPVIAFSQYQTALGYYNKLLKRISKILDLDISLSSYTAKHYTFSI